MQNQINFDRLPSKMFNPLYAAFGLGAAGLILGGAIPDVGGILILAAFVTGAFALRWNKSILNRFAASNSWAVKSANPDVKRSVWQKIWNFYKTGQGQEPNFNTPPIMPGSLLANNGPLGPQYDWIEGAAAGTTIQLLFESSFTILRLPLGVNLPQMLLRNKYWDRFKDSGDSASFVNQEQLNLEGDFNKHFRVYGQKGAEADLLSVLTPDVMEVIETKASRYNIEFYNQALFIIERGETLQKKKDAELFGAGLQIYAKLSNQLKLSHLTVNQAII